MQPPTALLTNDDGFEAVGLAALRESLRRSGFRVMTVAPVRNHSCGSHHVSIAPVTISSPTAEPDTYQCSGTPADCVRVALLGDILPPPDIVVSGINDGANAGEDITYSGTVSAAAEAARLGRRAIAVSQHSDDRSVPFIPARRASTINTDVAARVVSAVVTTNQPSRTVLNVNLVAPRTHHRIAACRVGTRDWSAARIRTEPGPSETAVTAFPWEVGPPAVYTLDNDYGAIRSGVSAVSILSTRTGLADAYDDHAHYLTSILSSIGH